MKITYIEASLIGWMLALFLFVVANRIQIERLQAYSGEYMHGFNDAIDYVLILQDYEELKDETP